MKGQALYRKAKTLIPGGTQLLSKRPEMFLPDQWPSYYSRCKGVEAWDLDRNRYIDMSITGIGACILGYADPDVDRAVKNAVDSGTMCTLNCPEEVELAELLCAIHPWAEMVRYARGGGEAMAIAVRIARAATGKEKIAFCGYHGWHDWYLSVNLADGKNLDGHLLPGLEPAGVPKGLRSTVLPFNFNRKDELEGAVSQAGDELAAIIVEPVRYSDPEEGFLQYVRETAKRTGAVLIFDEITSGWRMNVGGIHLLYGVDPDMAVFAKGISNGYPMAAIIGIRDVMEAAQKTFVSSTYWTERIGPTAALATIRKMRNTDVPTHLIRIGNRVRETWKEAAEKHSLKITVKGIPPLSVFAFEYGKLSQEMQTLFTQEMLKRGFLASRAFYASFAHQDSHVDAYSEAVNDVFALIARALERNEVRKSIKGPIAHTGFRRLT